MNNEIINAAQEAALKYLRNGLSVLPVRADGSKAPSIQSWKALQESRPSEDAVIQWYLDQPNSGVGIITGAVSRFLEVLDFDDPSAIQPWKDKVGSELLDQLVMVSTPSGGLHIAYRCPSGIQPNQKLAQRRGDDGKVTTLIETRGEGGYIIAPGSPAACHPANKEYLPTQGSLDAIPEVTGEQRDLLLSAARELNEHVEMESTFKGGTGGRFLPGDDFTNRGSWDFLWKSGWKKVGAERNGRQYVQRPGKNGTGSSATIFGDSGILYVHSSNAHSFDAGVAYTLFAAYALVVHAGDFRKAAVTLAEEGYGRLPLNDSGNAQRFVAQCADKVMYVAEARRWFVWDSKRWEPDSRELSVRLGKEVATRIAREAVLTNSDDDRKAITKWAITSGNGPKVRQMMTLAQSDLAISVNELDQHNFLLNCQNGTVDLRVGELRAHDPADRLTKLAPVDFMPEARAPRFHQFLNEIMPDPEEREFFQRVCGYALTGDQREQKIFFLTGDGANGKSTAMIAFGHVLGDYRQEAAPGLLLVKKYATSASSDLARLKAARMVVVTETGSGRELDEETVKRATGGDTITARFMYEDFFEFKPTHTLLVITNHKPEIRGQDHAIWRRISVIPFRVTFADEKQDKELMSKLLDEKSGILAWLVEGCVKWYQDGLKEPEAVRFANQQYRSDMDFFRRFLDDRCELDPSSRVGSTVLYKELTQWCRDNGERPISQREMAGRLRKMDCPSSHSHKGNQFIGIRLIPVETKPGSPDDERGFDTASEKLAKGKASLSTNKADDQLSI